MKLKAKAILSGLCTYIPGYDYMRPTGGTGSARYCYSVWLRHLILTRAARGRSEVPRSVAELGPGDSIGIGLAALLCGVEKYYALDVVRYSGLAKNLGIFDDLVRLYERREPVPGEEEFPLLNPKLECYEFPGDELTDEHLRRALRPERLERVRRSIEASGDMESMVVYQVPWDTRTAIRGESVDMIYSQAVLEHVEDLPGVYGAMRSWLRKEGVMSHQIDFTCHEKGDTWDGHWTYSDLAWKIVMGRRPYLLNRAPYSEHVRLLSDHGFTRLWERVVRTPSRVDATALARAYRALSESDRTTSGAYVVSALI